MCSSDLDQVVLRDLSGAITEGPGYNVFAHVDGRWLTPGHGTLAGITRRSLIELAREAGQRVDEGCLSADDLLRADEVLVTSTAGGVMPVTVVNGVPVGTGVPGPLTRDLKDRYWARHQDPRYSTPVRYEEPPGGPGRLPGAGGWSVAVQGLGLVLVPGGGGAVGVDDQGPAPAVDDDEGWVRPGRPAGIAPGGFPRPARRTRRAALTAPGSPRDLPAGARWPCGV